MGQITEDFIMRAMRCCQLGQHPSMTVWEARQLLTAWVEWQACRGEVERLRSGCQFGTDGSAVAICHRLADARAERDEANRVCEQWRQWSAGDQARIAELEAALRLARVVLPAANSLPQTQTLVGDVVTAVDKALRTSSPTRTVP